MDGYVCKCKEGYILDVNNITCTKVIVSDYENPDEFEDDNDEYV